MPQTPPARCSSTSASGGGARRSWTRWGGSRRGGCPWVSRIDRGRGCRRPSRGCARRRGRPPGTAVDRPGHLGRRPRCSPARTRHDPRARLQVFCHAIPGTWQAMGVMLSAAGSMSWLRGGPRRAGLWGSWTGRRRPGAPGPRASRSRRTWPVSAPRTRTRTRAAPSSGSAAARPRGDGAGRARGHRLRPAGLARARARARCRGGRGADLRGRRAQRAVAPDRRLGAGAPARAHAAAEDGAAFGAALLGGVASGAFADAGEAVAACVRVTDRTEPDPAWARATRTVTIAFGRSTRRCAHWRTDEPGDSHGGRAGPLGHHVPGEDQRASAAGDRGLTGDRPRSRGEQVGGGGCPVRRRARYPAPPRLLRRAARRRGRRGRLHPAAELTPRGLDDPCTRGRQARPV